MKGIQVDQIKTRKEFGAFLQNMRINAGVSQREVSEAIGYSTAQFVSNIERGLAPMALHCIRPWARAIKMDPNRIFAARVQVIIAAQKRKFKDLRP